MENLIDNAIRGAAGAIEHLVRTLVRDEIRKHLDPEADQLINVKNGPMSPNKLRRLVRTGELRGFKQGRDVFISASEFRAYVEKHPVPPLSRVVAPDPVVTREQDLEDEVRTSLGVVPADPAEHRAFETRLARRRAEGGERTASLQRAYEERDRIEESIRQREERRRKREERRRLKPPPTKRAPVKP
jgi:hypothetical protein